jgi:hypothetical protein
MCRREPRPVAGQASCGPRCPGLFGALAEPWQVERVLCAGAEFGFDPKLQKFLFYFSFGFKLISNFKILYLNIQSSKNYEISSVGFIIF